MSRDLHRNTHGGSLSHCGAPEVGAELPIVAWLRSAYCNDTRRGSLPVGQVLGHACTGLWPRAAKTDSLCAAPAAQSLRCTCGVATRDAALLTAPHMHAVICRRVAAWHGGQQGAAGRQLGGPACLQVTQSQNNSSRHSWLAFCRLCLGCQAFRRFTLIFDPSSPDRPFVLFGTCAHAVVESKQQS